LMAIQRSLRSSGLCKIFIRFSSFPGRLGQLRIHQDASVTPRIIDPHLKLLLEKREGSDFG
jgi:hypothetical protein